jgi:DNA repair ATPase RecN
MAQQEEIEMKIIEHSMQHQENAIKGFSRELKIAAIIILLFQFGIFFRFIGLYDQSLQLNKQIEQLHEGDKTLGKIQIQLHSLKEIFKPLEMQLKDAPAKLRDSFKEFEIFIGEQLQESSRIQSKESEAIQSDISVPEFGMPSYYDGLSKNEIDILKNPDQRAENYNDLIKRIVDKRIVQPTFEILNKQKEQLLEREFEDKKRELLTTLQSNLSTLNQFEQGLGEFEAKIHQVHNNLKTYKIKAPDSSVWWQTVRGKMQVFGTESVRINKITGELDKPEHDLEAFSQKLTTLIKQAENKKEKLNEEMEKLKDNYNEVETLLQRYSKPLSVIAVEPKDAVLYFPIIILGVFTYFFWRFTAIHQRRRSLMSIYKNLSLPDNYSKLFFSGFPWLLDDSAKIKSYGLHHPQLFSFILLGILPGIFAAISLYWIFISPSLNKIAPLFLYIVAAVCFVVSYIIAIMRCYRPKKLTHDV